MIPPRRLGRQDPPVGRPTGGTIPPMKTTALGLVAAAAFLAAPTPGHPSAGPSPEQKKPATLSGSWGGEGAGLQITEGGAQLFFDCAKGSIEGAITPDEDGRFEMAGRYVREGPGPARPEQTQGVGARYLGQVDGNTLTLSVRLIVSHEVLGPFTLTRNRMARVRECG
jgi:hypothetical protein